VKGLDAAAKERLALHQSLHSRLKRLLMQFPGNVRQHHNDHRMRWAIIAQHVLFEF
jgi:hypothetical protein